MRMCRSMRRRPTTSRCGVLARARACSPDIALFGIDIPLLALWHAQSFAIYAAHSSSACACEQLHAGAEALGAEGLGT
jgi:hypothetical protein